MYIYVHASDYIMYIILHVHVYHMHEQYAIEANVVAFCLVCMFMYMYVRTYVHVQKIFQEVEMCNSLA